MTEHILVSPKIVSWLKACQARTDEESRRFIDGIISGKNLFTRSLYYAMPIRADALQPDGTINLEGLTFFRPSIQEELESMGSRLIV